MGEDHRLHAVAQAELAEQVGDVRLDRRLGDDERALIDSALSCSIVGSPETFRRQLNAFVERTAFADGLSGQTGRPLAGGMPWALIGLISLLALALAANELLCGRLQWRTV